MTWPFLIINNFFSRCRTHLFLSLHAVFLLKQLWGKMVKHQIATVHATQQVVARLPKNEWVCSCHQPCLAGLREVEMLKPFLCLHPPECLAVLDQGFLPVFSFPNKVQWNYRSYFLLILITCLYRNRYCSYFIAQPYGHQSKTTYLAN